VPRPQTSTPTYTSPLRASHLPFSTMNKSSPALFNTLMKCICYFENDSPFGNVVDVSNLEKW
jgi:hypothetical protein